MTRLIACGAEMMSECFLSSINIYIKALKTMYCGKIKKDNLSKKVCIRNQFNMWYRWVHNMIASSGVFQGLDHSTCKVLQFWLPIVGCLIIEEFVGYTIKFISFLSKQTDLSFIQVDLAQNHKFLMTIGLIFTKVWHQLPPKLPSATTHTASFPPIVKKCRRSSPWLIRLYTYNSSSSIYMSMDE